MIRALIFDFDGLILDTESPDIQSWRETYAGFGHPFPEEDWLPVIGRSSGDFGFNPYEHLELLIGHPIDREAIRAKRRRRNRDLMEGQPILPGVETYIADAQRLGLRLGVASSSTREWVVGQLSRIGLSKDFDTVKCRDDVGAGKPDPGVYLAVLNEFNIKPEQAIALEDSPNGISAANAAGVYCLAVPNAVTRNFSFEHADHVVESLEDLALETLIAQAEESRRAL